MTQRLAILNYDFGDAINQSLIEAFPMLRFHIARKRGEPIPDELLAQAEVLCGYHGNLYQPAKTPNVRFIHSLSAGIDGFIDKVPDHVAVSNGAGVYSVALGEHVLALALALTRLLDVSVRNMCGAKEWKSLRVRGRIHGSHVSILDTGDIGTYVANCMRALGASKIVGYKLHPAEAAPPFDALYAGPEQLHLALHDMDYVIVCLPGTPFTKGCIDAAAFAAMKPGCIFINIGRGNIVDTAAMLQALESGHIGAVGLDVTEPEPLPQDHPLWDRENAIITPHYAGWAADPNRVADWFKENLQAYLAGKPLPGAVDRIWKY